MKRIVFALNVLLCATLFVARVIAQEQEIQPRFLVSQGEKYGYIDQSGRIAITPQFSGAGDFSEGRTCASPYGVGRRNVLIDSNGNTVASTQFSGCGKFSEGLGAVGFETEKTDHRCMDCDPFYHWGYVNQTGTIVIKPRFHKAGIFREGLAAVQNDDGKWGFIDKAGKTAIGFRFDYAESFSEGLALVVLHRRYGYIDHTGRIAIGMRFVLGESFSEGLALVEVGGAFIPPIGSDLATDADEKPGKFEYIDKNGRAKIRMTAEHASRFSEGYAEFGVVKQDGYLYCGYIDNTGRVVIEPTFGGCDDFSEGLANVLLQGKWYFIDKTGRVVISAPYFQVRPFHNGLASVQRGDSRFPHDLGYIDKSGKLIWQPQ